MEVIKRCYSRELRMEIILESVDAPDKNFLNKYRI